MYHSIHSISINTIYHYLFLKYLHNFFYLSLCELPETHLQLASNKEAIDQMMNVIQSKMFDFRTVQMIAILLLVLSYTSATHSHLIQCNTTERLVSVKFTNNDGQPNVERSWLLMS